MLNSREAVTMPEPIQPVSSMGRIIAEQPDMNTEELATYGSEYARVKAGIWVVDKMIEIAEDKYAMALASCYGDEFERVMEIYRRRPMVVTQERPRSKNYEDLMALQKAKEIYTRANTLEYLKKLRIEIDSYGAINGIQEYGQRMLENGLDQELVRAVIRKRASNGMVNTYESVKAIRDGTLNDTRTAEERRMARMAEMIMRANEHIRMENEYPEESRDEWDDHGGWDRSEWIESIEDRDSEESPDAQQTIQAIHDSRIDPYVGEGLGTHVYDMDETEVMGIHEEPEPEEAERDDFERIGPASTTPQDAIGTAPDSQQQDEIARIPPMGSSPTDAVGSVPNEEIARIGPDGGKPRDALELLETLFLQRPPCDCEEYAEWYRYKLKRDHGYDLDYDDEGNEVIIGRTGE